jgi:hypothetical protein
VISFLYHGWVTLKEKSIFKMNGFVALLLALICNIGGIYLFFNALSVGGKIRAIVVIILGLIIATSLTIVQPNEAKVLMFFSTFIGVIRVQRLWATIPFTFKSYKRKFYEVEQQKICE